MKIRKSAFELACLSCVDVASVAHFQGLEALLEADCDAHLFLKEKSGALTHTGDVWALVWALVPSQADITEGQH